MRLRSLLPRICIIISLALIFPVAAQDNPYRNAGGVTAADISVRIGPDGIASSDMSSVTFNGAGYLHKIGRVTIGIIPQIAGLDTKSVTNGNTRIIGSEPSVRYEIYRDLIKESVTLNGPAPVSYSYDLRLSDWITNEPDLSRPEVSYDANKTEIVTYPYTKQVTTYAKDSTIDINPDRWGNLVVYVNGEDVVVMPKPFALDATGKRFEMEYTLNKEKKTITVSGDLTGAKYPITIDPTERVTNGGFETGDTSGWTSEGNPSLSVISGGANEGSYYCYYTGGGGYSRIYRTVDYTGVTSASMAVKVFSPNTYDFVLSDGYWQGPWNFVIDFPGQQVTGWVTNSATPTLSGDQSIQIWTYLNTQAGIDSIHAYIPDPPTGGFTCPFTARFIDLSTNSPTSWSWNFGDGDSTNATQQNPVHTYNSAGTYTVSLTATNADGSDTETKVDYISVTAPQQTTFTVFAEGVSDYHGGQPPLGSAVPLASTFYQNIVGANNGGISWTGYAEFYNDDAGSKHWSVSEIFPIKADNADFALFAGHGANDRIYFGTSNSVLELPRTDMQFGGSKLKWLTLSSCYILDEDTQVNWHSVFNGLHILNSYETEGLLYDRQGGIYAARLKGGIFEGQPYQVRNIRDAWRMTLEDTIDRTDYFGASMWAEPCGNDYLPGYGSFCSAPSASIQYEKFDCKTD
ncbi:MAG: PKD domain protein [Methanoregula sp. PtaU1.Bin051]|nr:MAG: PKD domain protein [Methanoregula sp. PtaU1.Bin051]